MHVPVALLQAQPDILVAGDLMLDRTTDGRVERISPEAPVPIVRVTGQRETLGGAGNVARNLAALGCLPTVLGFVGDDDTGLRIRALLGEAGFADRLTVIPGHVSVLKNRIVSQGQQLLRLDSELEAGALAGRALEGFQDGLMSAQAVVLSDYLKGALWDASRLIGMARAAGLPVVVDPKGTDFERYRGASLLTPNRAELRPVVGGWSDESELRQKAESLCERLALEALLLTRSEEGVSLYRPGSSPVHYPAVAREVFDVTGAGDTVVAVLAKGLAVGLSLEVAAGWANQAAGVVVGKRGTAVVEIAELAGLAPATALERA